MRPLLFSLCLACAPAVAQDVNSDFEELGRVNLTLDGVVYEMVSVREIASGNTMSEEVVRAGFRTVNIFAAVLDADGIPGSPGVSFTFFVNDGGPDLISLEVYDEQGWRMPLSIGPDGGSGGFDSFSMDDRQVTATFSGDMARLDNTDAENPKIAEGAGMTAISGEMSVEVPLKE